MEWMNKILEASNGIEMEEDEMLMDKLNMIDKKLKENMQENIEQDRVREQRSLEISRQYYLGT